MVAGFDAILHAFAHCVDLRAWKSECALNNRFLEEPTIILRMCSSHGMLLLLNYNAEYVIKNRVACAAYIYG